MLETLIGYLVGAFITWLVSCYYYKRAGDDLKREAKELKNQTHLILTALEQAGFVELQRQNVEIVGFLRWRVRPNGWDSSSVGSPNIGHAP